MSRNHRLVRRAFAAAATLALAMVVQPALAQLPAFPGAKTQNSGADPVATGKATATQYVFTITLDANNYDPAHDVIDTVPAEFDVIDTVASCGAASISVKYQKKSVCKMQPDHLTWDLDAEDLSLVGDPAVCDPGDICACDSTVAATLQVTALTDMNPGHCKRGISYYEPTSCGPLALNDGAFIYDPATGEPVTDASNNLTVAACDSGLDATCETTDTDTDNDGWSVTCGECDDADPGVNPGATEICNGVDDNCDGQIDEGGVCVAPTRELR